MAGAVKRAGFLSLGGLAEFANLSKPELERVVREQKRGELGQKPTLNSFQRKENHQSMADFSDGSIAPF